MNKRIKELRSNLDISQEEFGSKINIKSRAHISLLENGERTPTDRIINDICREFNVNETWLRTGEGEMFVTMSRDEELADWAGRLVSSGTSNEFMKKFVHVLSKLDAKEWESLEKIVLLMVQENEKD